jgi:hypothetical protein
MNFLGDQPVATTRRFIMNPSNHLSSQLESLTKLALEQLKLLGYSKKSLFRYRTTWRHFVEFARQKHMVDTYSDELATQFVVENIFKDGKAIRDLEGWRSHMTFSMKVLGCFVKNGRILRSKTYIKNSSISCAFKNALKDYEHYCNDRLHLRASFKSKPISQNKYTLVIQNDKPTIKQNAMRINLAFQCLVLCIDTAIHIKLDNHNKIVNT